MFFNFLKNKKELLFFIFLLLFFFYRSPYILLNGRFMAEEGSTFFAYAYNNNFLASIFFIDFKSGYINIWANISAIVANFFDLLHAPLVSNYLSLLPKVFIIYIVLYKKSLLLDRFKYKILFCLIVFVSPLNVPEIWLNSINSQIFFCILIFSILFLKNLKEEISYTYIILIIIGGLTGIYSNILVPLFYFKFVRYKTSQDKYNFIFISFTAITQFLVVIYSKLSNLLYEGKIHSINIDLLLNYIYNIFFKTFLSGDLTKYLYNEFLPNSKVIVILFFIIFLFFLFVIYFLIKKNFNFNSENKFILFSLVYAFIAISFLVIIGGVGGYVGGRYASLPIFFFLTLILFLYKFFYQLRIKYLFLTLLFISLVIGFYEFRPSAINKRIEYNEFLDCIKCPDWSREIEKYNQNKNYKLKIWPYPTKTMSLN